MIVNRRRRPRALKLAAMLLMIAGAAELDAQTAANADWRQLAPWCAYLGGFDGGYDCSYYTFEQCMATARGLGNSCMPNPRAQVDPWKPARRTYKAHR